MRARAGCLDHMDRVAYGGDQNLTVEVVVGDDGDGIGDGLHAGGADVIQAADEAALQSWGASRRDMMVGTLRGRADALDALGDHDAAEADREAAR